MRALKGGQSATQKRGHTWWRKMLSACNWCSQNFMLLFVTVFVVLLFVFVLVLRFVLEQLHVASRMLYSGSEKYCLAWWSCTCSSSAWMNSLCITKYILTLNCCTLAVSLLSHKKRSEISEESIFSDLFRTSMKCQLVCDNTLTFTARTPYAV